MELKPDSVERAAKAIKKGEMVLMVDDENRENEGDLVIAAEKATAEKLNFMSKEARGLICAPITMEKAVQLDLPRMTVQKDKFETPFTVSVDAAKTGTGISIKDRLATIKTILNQKSRPEQLHRPGHVFPLVAREGGTLQRAGHTEGAIDLLQIAGMKPVAVICEIMNDDGSMARMPQLKKFSKRHSIKMVSIKSIIKHRLASGTTVKCVAKTKLPTKFGLFTAYGYLDLVDGKEYVALVKGRVDGKKNVLVRVHSACLTGDVFHSLKCDCNGQLHAALKKINKAGTGVLLYIPHHEGRGIGLLNKLKAYELQDKGKDTVEANIALGFENDKRDFGAGAQVLRSLGVKTMRLLTNNPKKLVSLEGFGLRITQQLPLKPKPNRHNKKYLETKKLKLGHAL